MLFSIIFIMKKKKKQLLSGRDLKAGILALCASVLSILVPSEV